MNDSYFSGKGTILFFLQSMEATALGHHMELVTKPVEQARKHERGHALNQRHSMVEKTAPALGLLFKV